MARRRSSHSVDRAAARAVAQGPAVAAELANLRSRAAKETRRVAPKGPTGMYGGSIVEEPIRKTPAGLATGYGSTDFAAHIVEFGSVNNQPYRPLHKGAQAAGLKVTDA